MEEFAMLSLAAVAFGLLREELRSPSLACGLELAGRSGTCLPLSLRAVLIFADVKQQQRSILFLLRLAA